MIQEWHCPSCGRRWRRGQDNDGTWEVRFEGVEFAAVWHRHGDERIPCLAYEVSP